MARRYEALFGLPSRLNWSASGDLGYILRNNYIYTVKNKEGKLVADYHGQCTTRSGKGSRAKTASGRWSSTWGNSGPGSESREVMPPLDQNASSRRLNLGHKLCRGVDTSTCVCSQTRDALRCGRWIHLSRPIQGVDPQRRLFLHRASRRYRR